MTEVFRYFIHLGLIGFGGPLALIANMQRDLVEKRKWLENHKFQNAFTLIKSMPGPIAFSTAVFFGKIRAGFGGAFTAGFALVFPSFLMMLLFGAFLSKFEKSPTLEHVMLGMQVGALAVIIASLKGLIKGYERDSLFWILVPMSILLNIKYPSSEPLIILGFGFILAAPKVLSKTTTIGVLLLTSALAYAQAQDVDTHSLVSLFKLTLVCFKAGAFVFGSGLAIVPLLEQEVVQHYHWLSHSQFLNALALGQITPGPVVITATVIGYYVWGIFGAITATIMIFLASFIHMSTWFPSAVDYLSKQRWIGSFSRGAMAAVLGSILLSLFRLGKTIEWDMALISIAVLALVLSYLKKLPTWAIIPVCGVFILIKFQFQ